MIRTVACLALACQVACGAMHSKPAGPDLSAWPEIRPDFRVEVLRARMHEYSNTFAAEVDLASRAIEQRATDVGVRRTAVLWRARAIPEMRKACFRLEPVGALVDAWVFARQMEQLFTHGAGATAFGALQPEAAGVSRRLLERMRQIGESIAVSKDSHAAFEQKFIDPWIAEHPLRDMTFVRDSPIARFAEQFPARGDMFQSVGTIEGLAVGLSQQARLYLADLPRQVRGEVDLLRADLLASDDLASLQGDLHVTAAGVDRLAAAAEGASSLIASERRIILDELSRQRAMVMDAISAEQQQAVGAVVRAFAAERGELLRAFEAQRLATLEWATAERLAVIAEVRRDLAGSMATLRVERGHAVNDLRQIVDAVLVRVALFLVLAVLLAPVVAHAYVRVWPHRGADRAAQRRSRHDDHHEVV